MPGKEEYEAYLAKRMAYTLAMPEELKQKVLAHRQEADYQEQMAANHK